MTRHNYEFTWSGGHTVNVWREGKNVDAFSVGDWSTGKATRADVQRGVRAWLDSRDR